MPDASLPAPQSRSEVLPSGRKLSAGLKAALATPTKTNPTTFELEATAWKCPASVSVDVREEAQGRARAIDQALNTPTSDHIVRRWIANLGVMVAGTMTVDDAEAKLLAYVPRLTAYPMAVFSEASLDACARQFEFFPTYAQLTKALDSEVGRLREERRRCLLLGEQPSGRGGATAQPRDRQGNAQQLGEAIFAAMRAGNYEEAKRLADEAARA